MIPIVILILSESQSSPGTNQANQSATQSSLGINQHNLPWGSTHMYLVQVPAPPDQAIIQCSHWCDETGTLVFHETVEFHPSARMPWNQKHWVALTASRIMAHFPDHICMMNEHLPTAWSRDVDHITCNCQAPLQLGRERAFSFTTRPTP